MKNLANCKPSEFLAQTNKIRKSVNRWLTDTDIMNIRKRLPDIGEDATDDERRTALDGQARKNFDAILDAMLEEHPDETLEVLALLCFVEPKNVDDYPMSDYLQAMTDMMNDRAVINFFTSLISLVNQLT